MSFAFLAHELRGDVTTLNTDASLLRMRLEKAATSELDLHPIALRLSTRSKEAVEKVKLLTGIRLTTAREVDIVECLDDALRAVRAYVPKNRAIKIGKCPHVDRPLVARADRAGLLLAFFNLLLNAMQQIELYPRKRGLVWVEANLENGTSWARLDFCDTGPGLHYSDFERIFDLGYSTKPEGTGLGLHISRQVIERIRDRDRHGTLYVARSVLNVETVFSVRLPLIDVKRREVNG